MKIKPDAIISLICGIVAAVAIFAGMWPWTCALLALCAGITGFLAGAPKGGRK